ncbi:hypothetical protein T492DRAFT_23936 [Pavlovales sp. CCMP2436]|nr:hypothetical protein T492DRAFT_23936 [Pavlovales sp. CCMP2436]
METTAAAPSTAPTNMETTAAAPSEAPTAMEITAAAPSVAPTVIEAAPVPSAAELLEAACAAAWAKARASPDEPLSWTNVLSAAEKVGDLAQIREAYTELLRRYPLCYGFWSKLAKLEGERGDHDAALAVFERGVAAVGQSTELWCAYTAAFAAARPDDVDGAARSLHERAVLASGGCAQGHPVWEALERFEHACAPADPVAVLAAQWRALGKPLREAEAVLARALALARASPAATVEAAWLSADERVAFESEMALVALGAARASASAAADAAAKEGGEEEETKKEEKVEEEGGAEKKGEAARIGALCLRAEAKSAAATVERALRLPLEAQLRRQHFHWKALETQQLVGWHAYLDFETGRHSAAAAAAAAPDAGAAEAAEAQLATARCEELFRRCLVACASYGEFWLRFAHWLSQAREAEGRTLARAELKRGASVFCPSHVRLGLAHALAEEGAGDAEGAAAAFNRLESASLAKAPKGKVPSSALEVSFSRANFERRRLPVQGKKDAADSAAAPRALLAAALARALTAAGGAAGVAGGSSPAPASEPAAARVLAAAAKLAHFELAHGGGAERARAVFDQLLRAPVPTAVVPVAGAPAAEAMAVEEGGKEGGETPALRLPRAALRKAWLALAHLERAARRGGGLRGGGGRADGLGGGGQGAARLLLAAVRARQLRGRCLVRFFFFFF